jgi:hypothetical protein
MNIPGGRLLVLEDQPKQADDAIATFAAKVGNTRFNLPLR